jgi:hypothetical protein
VYENVLGDEVVERDVLLSGTLALSAHPAVAAATPAALMAKKVRRDISL